MSSASGLVIAGAGDLGARLAKLRGALGDEVIALRRRDQPVPGAMRTLRVDLGSGEGFGQLPRRPEALVFCAAPDQRDEAAYRRLYLDGLRRLMDACEVSRLIFVSSTAVFAQDEGEWVDETSLAEPVQFNGRVLLEAEQALAPHPGGIALRLSGLYGPGREAMLRRARAGLAVRRHWSNRIHVQDAAVALSHLLDIERAQSLYLGNDNLPALEHEVQAWVRAQEGLPAIAAADTPVSGRRVDNSGLRDSGWTPAFADYRGGYSDLLNRPCL